MQALPKLPTLAEWPGLHGHHVVEQLGDVPGSVAVLQRREFPMLI